MKKPEIVQSWNKKVWSGYQIDHKNFPSLVPKDWDSIVVKPNTIPEHIFVMFELVGKNTSFEMAVWADDNITGLFTYRDWTQSSLPFVDQYEMYWSGFTFQKLEDAKLFVEEYGGSGNWMKDHLKFVKKCNEKRNER